MFGFVVSVFFLDAGELRLKGAHAILRKGSFFGKRVENRLNKKREDDECGTDIMERHDIDEKNKAVVERQIEQRIKQESEHQPILARGGAHFKF